MRTDLFDYRLPQERIAQRSVEPRDQAKMLVLDRNRKTMKDLHVYDLPDLLRPGDLLVFNDSKVFKARLKAKKEQATVEIFLLRPEKEFWLALAKPGKKLRAGDALSLSDGTRIKVRDKREDGTAVLDFEKKTEEVFALADRLGEIPVPPYVREQPQDASQYQTLYAKTTGSVAAPTAGFHFTKALFERLEKKGIPFAFVTLHVGLGTFRPMKTASLESHVMHEEWAHVPKKTMELIRKTKQAGHRVIAVGTTTVRALESWAMPSFQPVDGGGFTGLFIAPGHPFKIVDGILTNFHLPKSTLLVLVSSFAGRECILRAYRHAMENAYRFYSFGDAMLII